MTSMLRVSIITPSYNQAPFLEATIRSVLEQDYPNVEYIICDGGSTDGSVEIIRKYEEHLAWWCSEKDSGQSEAINKGLARATGEIVAWLNSDDIYLKHCVTTIVNAFHAHPQADLIYGDLELIDEQSRIIGKHPTRPYRFAEQITHQSIIPQPAAFWRREVLNEVGLLRQDLQYAMDFELWIRIGRRFSIMYYPGIIAQFRISGINKSSSQSAKWGTELIRILDDLYSKPHLEESILKLKNRAYAGACLMGAATCLTASETGLARHWLAHAVRYDPTVLAALDWWRIGSRAILGRRLYAIGRMLKMRLNRA